MAGITGNPWIDVPLVAGGALLGGKEEKIPWQQSNAMTQAWRNMAYTNPLKLGAMYGISEFAGLDPRQYILNMPAVKGNYAVGYLPGDAYSKVGNKIKKVPVYGQATDRRGNTVQKRTGERDMTWGDVLGPDAMTGPSPMGGVKEAILNEGYGEFAGAINNAAKQRRAQWVSMGISPEQADKMAADWAMGQKSNARLSGSARLQQFGTNALMALLGQPMAQSVSEPNPLAYAQFNANQEANRWQAMSGLGFGLGYQTGGGVRQNNLADYSRGGAADSYVLGGNRSMYDTQTPGMTPPVYGYDNVLGGQRTLFGR